MSKKVYIFLADGFEDIEGLTVVDLMRRAQIDIKTVSIKDIRDITTSHGIHMQTDLVFKETDFSDADMLVIPGGMPGTKYLGEYQPLCDLLTDFYKQGKKVAAICAAPSVLGDLGLLKGKKATCYPGCEERLTGASTTTDQVVTDGHITTSRGMGTAIPFALELVTRMCGKEKSEALSKSIIYNI